MEVLLRAALFGLMLLTSSVAFAAAECNLPPEVQRQDLHKLSEVRWVLVEAFTHNPTVLALLQSANSSIVEIKPKDDNETFMFIERNTVDGKCLVFRVNASVSDPETSNHTLHVHSDGVKEFEGVVSPYDDQGRINFYQACPSCLIIIYSGVFKGTPGRVLLIYRSEGKHLDEDELKTAEREHRKLAECLKFNVESSFRYDGKTEFCLDKKEETQ